MSNEREVEKIREAVTANYELTEQIINMLRSLDAGELRRVYLIICGIANM